MQRKLYSFNNFDIDVNGSSMLFLIWAIYAGIVIGVLLSMICRVYAHRIVKAAVDKGADSEANAKTVEELGLGKGWIVRRMLRADSGLRKVLCCANEQEFPQPKTSKWFGERVQKTPFDTAKFYLPEERRVTAEVRFPEESHPVRNFILAAAVLFVVAFLAVTVIPELLTMTDNLVTQIKPQSKFY